MWYLILSLVALILYLLESVVSLPFLLIMVIAQASFDEIRPSSIFAFAAGLLVAVGSGRLFGGISIYFLVVSLLIQIYRKRFSEENIGFLFVFSFIITNVYLWFFIGGKILFLIESVLSSILVIVLTSILYSLKSKS